MHEMIGALGQKHGEPKLEPKTKKTSSSTPTQSLTRIRRTRAHETFARIWRGRTNGWNERREKKKTTPKHSYTDFLYYQ